MPFDGPDRMSFGSSSRHLRFDVESTRPTAQNTPLFGLDGGEWHGFFIGLTGVLALVLGLSALLMSVIGA